MLLEPLRTYAGAATSENAELIAHLLTIHQAVDGKGTWLLDRGFDRRELYRPLVDASVAFVVRQRGDREVRLPDGTTETITAWLARQACPRPRRWPCGGVNLTQEVVLPETGPAPWLLVVGWRWPNSDRPLVLLVSPQARRPCRTGRWYVRAYLRRWGVEDATRGIKQRFTLEGFLVRTWRALRRLLWLVGWAFWWLNLWGEEDYAFLRGMLMQHR